MVSYVTPKKGVEYITYVSLRSQSNAQIMQANPTIAAGDFKVSIDGGALANPATLPAVTPAASKMVKITLSASEMNGDNITVICSDAAGSEWADLVFNIQTTAQQIDDLATQTSVNTIDDFLDTEIAAIKAKTDQLTFGTANRVDAQVYGMEAGTVTASAVATGAIDADALAADASAEIADAVWDEDATAHQTQGTFGQAIGDPGADSDSIWALANTNLDATVSSRLASASYTAPLDAAGTATAVWNAATATYGSAGSYGLLIETNLDGTVTSRASQTSLDTLDDYVDTEVSAIKTKTDFLPSATAGSAGGLFISGTNSSLTITGTTTLSDGLVVNRSTGNSSAIVATGSGTGSGLAVTGGATGHGIKARGGATSGDGANFAGDTFGIGIRATGTDSNAGAFFEGGVNGGSGLACQANGGTGHGASLIGYTSGSGLYVGGGSTGPGLSAYGGGVSGDGIFTSTISGHGMNLTATGSSKHGLFATGGTAGTSDGIKAAAGTGGVDIRGNITGNVTGTITTATSVTNPVTLTSSYDFAKGTTAMTESYPVLGATITPVQALYNINQILSENSVSGTTMTVKKRDQATTAKTLTLNDAASPTALTEAT